MFRLAKKGGMNISAHAGRPVTQLVSARIAAGKLAEELTSLSYVMEHITVGL
jgi:hypothetical protein